MSWSSRERVGPVRGRSGRLATSIALVVAVAAVLGRGAGVRADIMGDECDWFGSGLSGNDAGSEGSGTGRSVTPVYLRCGQGAVTWRYPRGALRVVLRLGATGRDFRGCVKASAQFAGARLFLEGPRSLARLHDNDSAHAHRELARCFTSRGGQAAIFVEATTGAGGGGAEFARETASFTYDLEPLPRGGAPYDPTEECRPCSEEELARAYCTSDLVARGLIANLENLDELQLSRLRVRVTKLLRHSTEDNALLTDANLVTAGDANDARDAMREVMLFRARACEAKHGPGEYVFMARRKLGDLTLTCAPRLEEWAEVRRTINQNGKAHCKLKS